MRSDTLSIDDFAHHLMAGDRSRCSALAHEYLATNHSVAELYENVFKAALYEVGRLWEANQISVATEHLATAIIEGVLNELFEQIISGENTSGKVIVAGVENERHQVGMKMVADVFEMKGWESFFLGTGIPAAELIRFMHQIKPDLLAISLSVYFNFANLLKMLHVIRKEFPELKIILGGQAFLHISPEAKLQLGQAEIINDLYSLGKYIDDLTIMPKNYAWTETI